MDITKRFLAMTWCLKTQKDYIPILLPSPFIHLVCGVPGMMRCVFLFLKSK